MGAAAVPACKVDSDPIAHARSAEHAHKGIIIDTVFCAGECDAQIAQDATESALILANDGDYLFAAGHYCHSLDKCVIDIM